MSWIITGKEAGSLGLLDQYGGAAAAYSLRNLSLYRTDPVVRVRRDNDNAEQDFTAAEVSDGTLAAWVGAGNDGFVRTWYDQSGNNQDASQATTGSQPKIVDAGSGLITDANGKPSINFEANKTLSRNLFGLTTASALDFWSYCVPDLAAAADATTLTLASFSQDGNNNREYAFGSLSTGATSGETLGNYVSTSSFGRINTNLYSRPANFPSLFNIQAYQTGFREWVNGSEILFNLVTGVSINQDLSPNVICDTESFEIGGITNQLISEMFFYYSNQSANRAAIEANINAHYSIF